MNDRYILIATIIWGVWVTSWWIAAFWSKSGFARAERSSYWIYLVVAALGFFCIFFRPTPVRQPLWLLHPLWPVPPWLGWTMVGLVAASVAFAWWARIHLGALWSGGIGRAEDHRIVDTGPYGLVRHPIYTSLILAAAAYAVLKATPIALAGTVLVALGFGLKARVEERFLGHELGEDDYAAYRARVPMLMPFVPTGR